MWWRQRGAITSEEEAGSGPGPSLAVGRIPLYNTVAQSCYTPDKKRNKNGGTRTVRRSQPNTETEAGALQNAHGLAEVCRPNSAVLQRQAQA